MADQTAPIAVTELTNNARIVFEAIDPTSGAAVAGVVVSNVAINGVDLSTDPNATEKPPPSPVTGAYTTGAVAV